MILPLITAMTLKTGRPMKIAKDSDKLKPGAQRSRRSTAKTGFMLIGVLMVAATMLRVARRRPR
ncbi:hypothetical protein GCM10009780_54900 [Actinomadura alba]